MHETLSPIRRNPQTGEKMKIKGKSVVTFKASKNLP
ncbi:MAG: HU family DNA-binding protein [Deltaproteobacteria bacterium]|nr:HU family DNA-binding protein [Deltaproteobacteria bacterium]